MARKARTTENLKDRMADALLDLLETKPYAEISVSEITDQADVGRATYYRHFTSKDDVLLHKFFVIFTEESDLDAIHEASKNHDVEILKAYFTRYFAGLAAYQHVLELIYARNLDYLLFVYMYRGTIEANPSSDPIDRYRAALHAATTFAIVDQWITSGFEQTPEEMVELVLHQLHPRAGSPTCPGAEDDFIRDFVDRTSGRTPTAS